MQGTWWLLNSFMDYGQIMDQTDGVWLSHRARQLPRAPGSSRTSLYDTTFQGFAVVHISLVYVIKLHNIYVAIVHSAIDSLVYVYIYTSDVILFYFFTWANHFIHNTFDIFLTGWIYCLCCTKIPTSVLCTDYCPESVSM